MISEVWSLGLFWLLWDTGHHLKYSRSPSSVTTALKASVSTLQGQFYGTDFPGDSHTQVWQRLRLRQTWWLHQNVIIVENNKPAGQWRYWQRAGTETRHRPDIGLNQIFLEPQDKLPLVMLEIWMRLTAPGGLSLVQCSSAWWNYPTYPTLMASSDVLPWHHAEYACILSLPTRKVYSGLSAVLSKSLESHHRPWRTAITHSADAKQLNSSAPWPRGRFRIPPACFLW